MTKLLIVYDSMMIGGTTTALLSLLNELDYTNFSVELLFFENTGAFIDMIPQKVKILPQAYKGNKHILVSAKKVLLTLLNGNIFRAIKSYCKYKGTQKGNFRNILMHYGFKAQVKISRKIKDSYDVAIGFIEGWSDQYVLSKKIKANRKIIWIHPDYKASYLIPEIDKKLFQNANAIVTVSKNCKKNIQEIFPEFSDRFFYIENVTSTKLIRSRANEDTPIIKKKTINICTVSRCDINVKGLDRVLQALARLKNENLTSDLMWHYIGDGRDYNQFKQMVHQHELEDIVICYGHKTNPLVYLKQMDCFVLASRYEGKPISIEEALSLDIPCFITEYASANEQIENGVTGEICKNEDEEVYEMIKGIIRKPSKLDLYKRNLTIIANYSNPIRDFYRLIRGDSNK